MSHGHEINFRLSLGFLGHRMVRLSVDDLVAEAVDAFKNNECIEEPPEEPAILVRPFFV